MILELDVEEYTEKTSIPNPDDDWGRANTHTSRTFGELKIVEKDGYNSFALDCNFGDTIYLIIAEWSTGNSFGRDENSNYDIVTAYTDLKLAKENLSILKKVSKDESVEITFQNGKKMKYYRSWLGYFERLNNLEIILRDVPNK